MKIMYPVKSRYDGSIMFNAEIECDKDASTSIKLGLAIQWGVKNKKSMSGAYLRGADLSGAYLGCANLREAYLGGAYLRGAYLGCANLSEAYLRGADLSEAYLGCANLREAYLGCADLSGAYLGCADLKGAYLRGAYLGGACLSDAYLGGANLSGAKNAECAIAQTNILPDGDIIGWKKCRNNVIIKLLIPSDAKRSNASGRKCRAEYANVLEVIGSEVGISQHDGKTEYVAGQVVKCSEPFDENRFNECASGIHFFITRIEAERY